MLVLPLALTQCVGWSRGLPVQCCLSKAQKSTATSVQGCWPWHVNPLTQVWKALLAVWIRSLEETVMYGFKMLMKAGYWAEIRQPLLVLWLFWRGSNAEVLGFYSAFDSSVSPIAQLDQRSKKPSLSFLWMWKNTPINMKLERGCPPHLWQQQHLTNYIWLQSHPHLPKNITLTFGVLHGEDENMTPVHKQVVGLAPLSSPTQVGVLLLRFVILTVSGHTLVKPS